jgi:hypothetical protein
VGSNPVYSPEVSNIIWFAIMFSTGIPSSDATGCKKGKQKTDEFMESFNDNTIDIHKITCP